MRRTRTDLPSATGWVDVARQSSPWMRIIPSGPLPTGSMTTPSVPIISSRPVACFHFRERRNHRLRGDRGGGEGQRDGNCGSETDSACSIGRANEEERAEKHRNDAAAGKNAVTRKFRLENKE